MNDTTPTVGEFGPVTDRHGEIDGYTVTIVSFAAEIDGAPLLKGLKATRSTSRPGTRRRTVLTPSWSCSARPARSARPRRRLASELVLDLIDEVEVQLEQPAQEAGNDQQVLLAMR